MADKSDAFLLADYHMQCARTAQAFAEIDALRQLVRDIVNHILPGVLERMPSDSWPADAWQARAKRAIGGSDLVEFKVPVAPGGPRAEA